MYNFLERLVLEDKKEYIVASRAEVNGINFYLLVDINNPQNFMYCRESEDGKKIAEVKDPKILKDLVYVLYENSKAYFDPIEDK